MARKSVADPAAPPLFPPVPMTPEITGLVADICERVGTLAALQPAVGPLRLRRECRVRSTGFPENCPEKFPENHGAVAGRPGTYHCRPRRPARPQRSGRQESPRKTQGLGPPPPHRPRQGWSLGGSAMSPQNWLLLHLHPAGFWRYTMDSTPAGPLPQGTLSLGGSSFFRGASS